VQVRQTLRAALPGTQSRRQWREYFRAKADEETRDRCSELGKKFGEAVGALRVPHEKRGGWPAGWRSKSFASSNPV